MAESKVYVAVMAATAVTVQVMLAMVLFAGVGNAYAANAAAGSCEAEVLCGEVLAESAALANERLDSATVLYCQEKAGVAKMPARPSLASVSSKKAGKLTVKTRKVKGADGYEFKVGQNRKCSKGSRSKLTSKLGCTFAGLKQGKRYYVKVRAYRDADGERVFGKWSKAKSAKVRKSKSKRPKKDGIYSFDFYGSSTAVTATIKGSQLVIAGDGKYFKDIDSMAQMKSKPLKPGRYTFKLSSDVVFYASPTLVPNSRKYAHSTKGDYLFTGKGFVKAMNKGAFPWVDVMLRNGKATIVCCDTWY